MQQNISNLPRQGREKMHYCIQKSCKFLQSEAFSILIPISRRAYSPKLSNSARKGREKMHFCSQNSLKFLYSEAFSILIPLSRKCLFPRFFLAPTALSLLLIPLLWPVGSSIFSLFPRNPDFFGLIPPNPLTHPPPYRTWRFGAVHRIGEIRDPMMRGGPRTYDNCILPKMLLSSNLRQIPEFL